MFYPVPTSGRRLRLFPRYSLPEIAALVLALVADFELGWHMLLVPTLLRAAMILATAVHGAGHALCLPEDHWRHFKSYMMAQPLQGLRPFAPIFIPGVCPLEKAPRMEIDVCTPARRRLIALGGPLANIAMLLLALAALRPSWGVANPSHQFALLFAATNAWILITSWTDYLTLITGAQLTVFCGNFGILSKRDPSDKGVLPRRFRAMTERMGHATDIRGQQAGGLAVLSGRKRFVGVKIVNEKRADLTRALLRAFGRHAALCRIGNAQPLKDVFHLIAHYRYGTSSEPAKIETHWHRWTPPKKKTVWSLQGPKIIREKRFVENLITHNGDFERYIMPWETLDADTFGDWLGDVLGVQNKARGDSPKIAGAIDLLRTQGQWEAALRLSYAMRTQTALPRASLKALAEMCDEVFKVWIDGGTGQKPQVIGAKSLQDFHDKNLDAVERLLSELVKGTRHLTKSWPDTLKRSRHDLLSDAVKAFFFNDLYEATHLFMSRAEGTFGLVTTTSVEAGSVVLAVDRQPLSIAVDPASGTVLYASETTALKEAWGPSEFGKKDRVRYRYDLSDGEIVHLAVRPGLAAAQMTTTNLNRWTARETHVLSAHMLEKSRQSDRTNGWIKIPPISDQNLENKTIKNRKKGDRVLEEMRQIPAILSRQLRDWDDPGSMNRRTAAAFSAALLQNASTERQRAQSPRRNVELDLLVIGLENNFALAQRFVADLRCAFPLLEVDAVDAVAFCEDPKQYAIGEKTVTLAISQSGQTFNTLDATKFMQSLHMGGKTGPVFAMTGEVDTLMGRAVGQSMQDGADWQARIFSTGFGWGTAEPATLSAAALHSTLTQLFLQLTREALFSTTVAHPFGCVATENDRAKIETFSKQMVSRAASIIGSTDEGWSVNTAEHAALIKEGTYLSRLLIEPALVFICTAIHLFLMLWLGWNPVLGLWSLMHETTGWNVFETDAGIGRGLSPVLQTAYFLFSGAAFTLALRLVERRPLWDRVFVGRTLVIGETGYVKDVLAQYVSKLFSLSYEFAGFAAIHAADSRSGELLHGYGHRISRGLVLFLGLPDGRWAGRERAEAAACMTSSHARGVRNMNAGATVIGLGHNPATAHKVNRFVLVGASNVKSEEPHCSLRGDWSDLAKHLQETRFASFERLLAGFVIFHTSAARTRDFINRIVPVANLVWFPVFASIRLLSFGRVRPSFGKWDIARTQSGTRISTTASPVPSIHLTVADFHEPDKAREVLAPHVVVQALQRSALRSSTSMLSD
ncbi:hypothetical protein [Celeribacter litoreus]|uniref:hypothetical protein n=1 Tax=Celeribacter litoreus TaxID=2876714 RepID=UPI001CCC6E7D|nr:hypothetical protein [Celeribacter litoreus]MCA0044932.1 hypothetical protein [Celeribacter litoreus]